MKQRRFRKETKEVNHTKNLVINIILIILLFLSLLFIIFFIDPSTFIIAPVFFTLFSLMFFLITKLFSKSKRRSLIISLSLTVFLTLRFLGIGSLINFILISGIAITTESYYWYTSKHE